LGLIPILLKHFGFSEYLDAIHCSEVANEEIENEIFEELSKDLPEIPWFKKVEKVTVTEA
jgi:hypothetical protein